MSRAALLEKHHFAAIVPTIRHWFETHLIYLLCLLLIGAHITKFGCGKLPRQVCTLNILTCQVVRDRVLRTDQEYKRNAGVKRCCADRIVSVLCRGDGNDSRFGACGLQIGARWCMFWHGAVFTPRLPFLGCLQLIGRCNLRN